MARMPSLRISYIRLRVCVSVSALTKVCLTDKYSCMHVQRRIDLSFRYFLSLSLCLSKSYENFDLISTYRKKKNSTVSYKAHSSSSLSLLFIRQISKIFDLCFSLISITHTKSIFVFRTLIKLLAES